jgi:hypothetical protein
MSLILEDITVHAGCKVLMVVVLYFTDCCCFTRDFRLAAQGEGKTKSLLSATFRQQKLVGSREDFCFLRGECIKLGEGDT